MVSVVSVYYDIHCYFNYFSVMDHLTTNNDLHKWAWVRIKVYQYQTCYIIKFLPVEEVMSVIKKFPYVY